MGGRQAEGEEERQKFKGDLGSSGGWIRSILQGTDGSERPEGSQGKSRQEDSWRAEGKRKGDGERSRESLEEIEELRQVYNLQFMQVREVKFLLNCKFV